MRLRSLATALAVAALALPTVAADVDDSTLFLRAEGAGCDLNHSLQLEAGEDEATCSTKFGAPLYEIDQQAGLGLDAADVYTAKKDILGFVLDAKTDLAGTLTFRHGSSPAETEEAGVDRQPIPAGGGHYEVDLQLKVNGKIAMTETLVYQGGSADIVEVPFSFDIDDAFDGQVIEKLSFSVGVGGVTPNSGWVALNGASFINIPRAA